MMTYDQMLSRFGRKKTIDMVVNSKRNGKTGAERDRGIKGRIKFRKCEHGTWVIDNFKQKPCLDCMMVPKETKASDFKEGFNIGLGCYVESRSEEKRAAKSMGLLEAG